MPSREIHANSPAADLEKSHPEPMPSRADHHFDRTDIVPLCVLTALIVACKIGTLNTLYYWDEMAAWVPGADWLWQHGLIRVLPGLHPAAVFGGHPPALTFTLAAFWSLFGHSNATAHALILIFSAIGVCFTYLLGRLFYDVRTSFLAALLLLTSPMYLAQSGMFLGDLPVMALGVASIYFALCDLFVPYFLCAAYMVLIKETGLALVVALVLYFLVSGGRSKATSYQAMKYSAPLAVGLAFFIVQKLTSGQFCFIYDQPGSFRFIEISRSMALPKLWLVVDWLFVQQSKIVLSALFVLALVSNKQFRLRPELKLYAIGVSLFGIAFCIIYSLPRYLLPVFPFVYLAGSAALTALIKTPRAQLTAVLGLVALFLTTSLTQQPFGNSETSMKYLDVIRLHRSMYDLIQSHYPHRTVYTSFPHSIQLRQPSLGYVSIPFTTMPYRHNAGTPGDLVLLSAPGAFLNENEIFKEAEKGNWQLVQRMQNDSGTIDLYELAQR